MNSMLNCNASGVYDEICSNLIVSCVQKIEDGRLDDCFRHYAEYFRALKAIFV